MARRKKGPWKRKQDGCWYTTVGRKLIKLGEADTPYEDIERAYFEHHSQPAQNPGQVTVAALCDSFLEFCKRHRAETTYEFYQGYLKEFVATIGHRHLVNNLTPQIVQNWAAGRYFNCSQSVRHNAERSVVRAMNWGVKERIINRSPLVGMVKTQPTSREAYLTPEQYAICLEQAREPLKGVLTFLWETGCRPQELRKLRAEWIDGSKIVFPALQSKGKKRRTVIYLNERALAVVADRLKECPKGILFRNKIGNAWTKEALNCAFARLRAKTKIKVLCPYTLRHGFATAALKRGVDGITVGVLMNHSNPGMVAQVYQHLAQDDDYLLGIINV